MRQYLAIFGLAIYLVFSAGLAVNVHYCCGKVDSISVSTIAEACCCSKNAVTSGCCNDEQYVFMLDDEQQSQELIRVFVPVWEVDPIGSSFDLLATLEVEDNLNAPCDKPPPKQNSSRVDLCSLTFYG